jgi:site-specific recombinase XerD
MLRELEQQTGIDHVVHPHKFRRTFATNMARRGMPIQEIASIMGHEKIETTMKYIVLNKEDIKHDYGKFA